VGFVYIPGYLWTHYVFKKGRNFSAVCPYNAAYVERWTEKRVPVIPNSIPVSFVESGISGIPETGRPSPYVIASAISAAPFKNARRALQAYAQVRRKVPDSKYMLMGPGLEDGGREHAWAKAKGLTAGVEFLGPVRHKEALERMKEIHVLFHPSLEDCCNNSLLEAMALGKLVVAGALSGGCAWTLDNGKAGVLVDVHDVKRMADTLVNTYEDWHQSTIVAQAGRTFALMRYAPDTVVSQYERLYADITLGSNV